MRRLWNSPRGPVLAILVVSLSVLATGLALATFLRLAACPLCIIQRLLYLLLAAVAALGLFVARPGNAHRLIAVLLAIIAGSGVFTAGYQVWLQRFARHVSCTADQPWWEQFVNWAGAQVPWLFLPSGLCSDPAWRFAGLSIAEWSLLTFLGLLVLSVHALLRRPR